MTDRILIIDDDSELCELLTNYLQQEGFFIDTVGESREGLDRARSGDYSFVVLDVMLPGMSGFEVLREIRLTSHIPILMLTARGDEVDRIVGLEMGADDYLPKPFNPRELIARIRAIRRRGSEGEHEATREERAAPVSIGDIVLDPGTRTVVQNGSPVSFTAVEFSLLQELVNAAGHVVEREDLARKVLGRKLELFDRSIDVHVSSLRKKLGHRLNGVERIKTIRSVGYLYTCA